LRNPQLPAFLDEVALTNLKLGASRVDLAIRREPEGGVSLRVTRTSGSVRVSLV
jgi:hypothetical protein